MSLFYNRKEWLQYVSQAAFEPGFIFDQSGILNVNKPPGLSSMDVIRVIKKNGRVRKAGHGGTLDPMATGVLPVLINRATRLSDNYLGSEKSYDGTFRLGVEYDTQDITGKLVRQTAIDREVSVDELNALCVDFTGEIMQVPPVFSALKKGGRPLYDYARKGEKVIAEKRPVTVLEFSIREKTAPNEFSFYVHCQKGVYVRTLLHDLGQLLGYGAAMTSLRRLSVGPLSLDRAVDLKLLQNPDDIQKYLIMPDED